jgi:hypothetical protein
MQEIITYIVLAFAVVFLVKKYFFKSKKKGDCGPNCNC